MEALGAVVGATWPPTACPPPRTPPASSNNCGIWFPFNTKCETLREVTQKGICVNRRAVVE